MAKPDKPPKPPKDKDKMAYPNKPTAPSLNASHGFANGLQAAWLFDESTGVTIRDQSGNGLHLAGTCVSDGSWTTDGDNRVYVRNKLGALVGRWARASTAALNFASGAEWTEIWWLAYRGGDGGSRERIRSRVGNLMDFGIESNTKDCQFFTGAWVSVGDTAASGAPTCFAFVHLADNNVRFFKNGVFISQNAAGAVANTGAIHVATAPAAITEYINGDWIAGFVLSRALADAEIASHFSDPFGAWEPVPEPPADQSSANISVFQPRPYMSPGSYRAPPLPHLLDWLGGSK